jgi:hypothetical protein
MRAPEQSASATLSAQEQTRLRVCEEVIEKSRQTIAKAGAALEKIRARKLYRSQYQNFAEYCRGSLGITDRRARELISEAQAIRNKATLGGELA